MYVFVCFLVEPTVLIEFMGICVDTLEVVMKQ